MKDRYVEVHFSSSVSPLFRLGLRRYYKLHAVLRAEAIVVRGSLAYRHAIDFRYGTDGPASTVEFHLGGSKPIQITDLREVDFMFEGKVGSAFRTEFIAAFAATILSPNTLEAVLVRSDA